MKSISILAKFAVLAAIAAGIIVMMKNEKNELPAEGYIGPVFGLFFISPYSIIYLIAFYETSIPREVFNYVTCL